MRPGRSIVLKLLLLISVLLTAIFACTGYFLENSIAEETDRTMQGEILSSFRAYEALWREHTEHLAAISRVISRTADVRAAFMTHDRATIEDSAGELWSGLSVANSLFTVTDGSGRVLVTLGQRSPFTRDERLDFLAGLESQRSGFLQRSGRLFQVVVTPVFVDASRGSILLNVLVTGFELDSAFLASLEAASGGSDLVFNLQGEPVASTLDSLPTVRTIGRQCSVQLGKGGPIRIAAGGTQYLALGHQLPTLLPGQTGELCIVRSLASAQQAIASLRHRITAFWIAGLVTAVVATYELVRRTMQPVGVLDRAASEIARGNLATRVNINSDDELGRLGETFNTMSASLESARSELIQQERLSAVARLATFVVHDLRNPLASIYAGAEMLVDNDLPATQIKRLARNMYRASQGVMEILGELRSVARNKVEPAQPCLLNDLIQTAWHTLEDRAVAERIEFWCSVPEELELKLDRAPMERVFHNIFENAINAMTGGGKLTVESQMAEGAVLLWITDTGQGIAKDLRPILFQPFATKGRGEGLGLGLALSKQTVIANGGDLWADFTTLTGTRFVMRLPL